MFGIFPKKTRAEISSRMHRSMGRDLSYGTDSGPKTKTVSDPNFQVTATAAATATTSQQLSHLARALDHHAQGPIIPFGGNPSLRYISLECLLAVSRSLLLLEVNIVRFREIIQFLSSLFCHTLAAFSFMSASLVSLFCMDSYGLYGYSATCTK